MTDTPRLPPAPACRSLPAYVRHWAATTPDRRAFTFVDHPAAHPRGVHRTLTWRRLDLRVRALAARLAEEAGPGARVALLCPQGTRYVTAFLAALAARMVAVPLYPPGLPGHGDRLRAVLADACPAVVVTTSELLGEVREFCAGGAVRVVAADLVPDAAAGDLPRCRRRRTTPTSPICSTPPARPGPRRAWRSRTPTSSPTPVRR